MTTDPIRCIIKISKQRHTQSLIFIILKSSLFVNIKFIYSQELLKPNILLSEFIEANTKVSVKEQRVYYTHFVLKGSRSLDSVSIEYWQRIAYSHKFIIYKLSNGDYFLYRFSFKNAGFVLSANRLDVTSRSKRYIEIIRDFIYSNTGKYYKVGTRPKSKHITPKFADKLPECICLMASCSGLEPQQLLDKYQPGLTYKTIVGAQPEFKKTRSIQVIEEIAIKAVLRITNKYGIPIDENVADLVEALVEARLADNPIIKKEI